MAAAVTRPHTSIASCAHPPRPWRTPLHACMHARLCLAFPQPGLRVHAAALRACVVPQHVQENKLSRDYLKVIDRKMTKEEAKQGKRSTQKAWGGGAPIMQGA